MKIIAFMSFKYYQYTIKSGQDALGLIHLRVRFGGREGCGLIPRSSGSEINMFAKQIQFNTPMAQPRGSLFFFQSVHA